MSKGLAETRRAWAAANKDKIRRAAERFRKSAHGAASLARASRKCHLANTYGMTPAQYDAMLISQSGRCGICLEPARPDSRNLFIDHDHATGKVRGLLCHGCNTAIGYMKDSKALLMAASAYLDGAS